MQPVRSVDPRLVIGLGVLLLVGAGLLVRSTVFVPPGLGYRINQALDLTSTDADEAGRRLQRLVVERPEDPDLWRRAGVALGRANRPYEAAVYLRRASEMDSTSSLIQIQCAKALIRAGFPDEAAKVVDAYLARDPDDPGTLYMAAAVAAAHGNGPVAGDFYRRAVALGAWHPDRFRHDRAFDPVRNDSAFLQAVYDSRVPGSFLPREDSS